MKPLYSYILLTMYHYHTYKTYTNYMNTYIHMYKTSRKKKQPK